MANRSNLGNTKLTGRVHVPADLVLYNGYVLTMNSSQPHAEAIAVKDRWIVAVGTNNAMDACVGDRTKQIDLHGKTVVPGFIDTHIHVSDCAYFLTWINLQNIHSIKELQEILRLYSQRKLKGEWIVGYGWDQEFFEEKRFPTLKELDEAVPDNPTILYHKSRKFCAVNTRALKYAGLNPQDNSSFKPSVKQNSEAAANGVLVGEAANVVWRSIPQPGEEALLSALQEAFHSILEAGITGVHWLVSSTGELALIRKFCSQTKVPLRTYLILPSSMSDKADIEFPCQEPDQVRITGIEVVVDGYLSAKTAALHEPYCDGKAEKGLLFCTTEALKVSIERVFQTGKHLMLHVAGDLAVDTALSVLEEFAKKNAFKGKLVRLDQAAVLNERLVKRIKEIDAVVSVQPLVAESEFSLWSAIDQLGRERARWLYPLKTLFNYGICVSAGSDFPMEPLSPLLGIKAAVTRKFFPEERINIHQGLQMYTINAAKASGDEKILGSIQTGKIANLTVLSQNPMTTEPDKLDQIRVEMTIVNGEIVYSRQ